MEKQKLGFEDPQAAAKEEQPVATQILQEFADVSTCHGVGRISGSKPLWLKIVWALITSAAFCVFNWQLYNLVDKFYSYPVTVEISHEFKELDFPSVSFCNLNRFRNSQKTLGGPEFTVALAKFESASNNELSGSGTSRKKRAAEEQRKLLHRVKRAPGDTTTEYTATTTTTVGQAATGEPATTTAGAPTTSTGPTTTTAGASNTTPVPTTKTAGPTTTTPGPTTTTAGEPTTPTNTADTTTTTTGESTTTTQSLSLTTGETTTIQNPSSTSTSTSTPAPTTTTTPAPQEPGAVQPSADEERGDPVNEYFEPDVDLSDKPWFNPDPAPTVSSEIAQNLTALLRSTVGLGVQRSMGHRIDDMIHECSWAGKQCTPLEFAAFSHPDYGNCYTFNDGQTRAIRTVEKEGPLYGLSMVLYIEQMEYIKILSPTAGIRMLVHPHDVQPFPDDDGFDINPGQKVSVKLAMKRDQRLPDPYSPCLNSSAPDQEFMYNKNYSVKGCRKSCIQRNTIKECGCGNPALPLVPAGTSSCGAESFGCMKKISDQVLNGTIGDASCECPIKCREMIYSASLSAAEWPGDAYLKTIADQYSKRNDVLKDLLNSTVEVRKNFLKVEVFYEELRYMISKDIAAYGVENLLGDIGGQLGLWIGISVITLAEFVQLIGELISLFFRRGRCTPPPK